eukprot:1594724-Heterocapsa_arctica.AAC.1
MQVVRGRPRRWSGVAARRLAGTLCPSSGAVLHGLFLGGPFRLLQKYGKDGRGEQRRHVSVPLNKGRCH